jgi:hypothetical protein
MKFMRNLLRVDPQEAQRNIDKDRGYDQLSRYFFKVET